MIRRSIVYLDCSLSWEENRPAVEWPHYKVHAGKWKAIADLLNDAKTSRRLRLQIRVGHFTSHPWIPPLNIEPHQGYSHHLQTRDQQETETADQGRTFHLTSLDPSSKHRTPSGVFTSLPDYRFAVRARLNLLPT